MATKILILGGGFGGLYAALELERTLARRSDVEVTLVNRDNFFLFTPMLHEVAASDVDVTHIVSPVRKLVRHGVLVTGEVEHIDLEARRVRVAPAGGRTPSASSRFWRRTCIHSTSSLLTTPADGSACRPNWRSAARMRS